MKKITLIQLIVHLNEPREASVMITYTVGQLIRLFAVTISSQRLINESAQLSENM